MSNERARVYTFFDGEPLVFACSYRTPRRSDYLGVRLADNGSSQFKLVGETAAHKVVGAGCSRGRCEGTYVESRSARTGRRLQRVISGVDQYVMKANGSLAVAGAKDDIDPRLRLVKADSTGTMVLADDIERASLAIAGSRIYWTEGGVPRSATLE